MLKIQTLQQLRLLTVMVLDWNIDGAQIVNYLSETYVAWNWKAGGSASSNSDGSITSSVSANQTAGFSIVTFTMTSGDNTVGHGLGTEPDFLIFKRRDGVSSWVVWARPFGENTKSNLLLNSTAAEGTSGSGNWIQNITDSVVGIGNYGNMESSGDHIMYAFASVDGYSKVGSYVGAGEPTFVHTGFRPAWIMVKNIDTSTHHWVIYDNKRNTHNVMDKYLYANSNTSEGDNDNPLIL